jgi:hypothetical protein
MLYTITIDYRTPKGRPGTITETVYGASFDAAKATAERIARLDPRRRIARVVGFTVEPA